MFALLALASSIATASCSTPANVAQVRAAQARLFAIPTDTDDLPTDAPPTAQTSVPAMREALAAAITSYMQCSAGNISNTQVLQQNVATLLTANAPKSPTKQHNGYPDHTYGDDLTVDVKPMNANSRDIAIDTSFSTGCGNDHILLLFQRTTDGWQRTLDWHSDKYTKPSDAFGDFFLYTNAPGPGGSTLIAIAHGHPWCTSRFSGFDMDLLQPATSSSGQQVLAHTSAGYSRGDTTPTLKPGAQGVTLRLDDSSRDLENAFTFIGVFRYRTMDGKLQRLPVATNARDFVDSWLDEPWPLPPDWSAPGSNLQAMHDHFDFSKNQNAPSINYGPTHACAADPQHFQIEIDPTDGAHDFPAIYAQVRQNTGSFTMLAFTTKSDPTCTGPDLLKKR
jgi:hypothetical protein